MVALAVPITLEWRQHSKRERDRRAVLREVVSLVDRVVAYHDVGSRLIDHAFVYHPEFEAADRICENSRHLNRSLEVLISRPDLTDGAVAAAAAAESVVHSTIGAMSNTRSIQTTAEWENRKHELGLTTLSASIASQRSAAVRHFAEFGPSSAAMAIREKYDPLIASCLHGRQTNEAPDDFDLDATPW